jgi:hypothetical protein
LPTDLASTILIAGPWGIDLSPKPGLKETEPERLTSSSTGLTEAAASLSSSSLPGLSALLTSTRVLQKAKESLALSSSSTLFSSQDLGSSES